MYIKSIIIVFLQFAFEAFALQVHGHRGSRWTHPENTIPAFEEALSAEADFLELDLGMSKDGVLVVTHDPMLNSQICRFKNGGPLLNPVIVREVPLSDLKEIDCGAMINPRFPSQKTLLNTEMPTFDEFLDWFTKTAKDKVRLNIEMKFSDDQRIKTASSEEFAKALVKSLKKHKVVNRSVVQSFNFESLKVVRKLLPEVRISLLFGDKPWAELERVVQEARANIISPHFKWVTEENVKKVHQLGLEIVPWTVNDEQDWRQLKKWGVDAIITDRPRDLVKFLKSSP